MSDEDRLYGLPHAEHMHFDLASCYESDIDDWDAEPEVEPPTYIIEEWSVRDCVDHVPSVDTLLDWLSEWTCENGEIDEDGCDTFTDAMRHPDVKAEARRFLDFCAARISYRMADKLVATHTITWDADGEPLDNGEPIYVNNPEAQT